MSRAFVDLSAAVRRLSPHQLLVAAAAVAAWGVVISFTAIALMDAGLGRRIDPGPPMVAITAYPEAEETVRIYYRRYEEAQAACDIEAFLKHYPELARGLDLGAGINLEQRMIPVRCDHVRAIRFDLESYEPMGANVHPGGIDVRVHGLEHWHYKTGDPGAGEFITTLSLREAAGNWTVVRTDEVTLGELHEQH